MWKKLRKSRFSTIHFLRVFLIKSRNLWNPLFQSVTRHSTYNIKYSINFPRIHHIYIPYIRSINYSTTYHLTKKKKRKTKNKNPFKVNFAPSPTSSIVLTRIWPFIELSSQEDIHIHASSTRSRLTATPGEVFIGYRDIEEYSPLHLSRGLVEG